MHLFEVWRKQVDVNNTTTKWRQCLARSLKSYLKYYKTE